MTASRSAFKVSPALALIGLVVAACIGFSSPVQAAPPPAPATPVALMATITSTASCVGTSCTVVYTATTNEAAGAFLYGWNPHVPGVLFNGVAGSAFGFGTVAGVLYTFTETGIPCTASSYEIDVPFSDNGFITPAFDVDNSGTLPGVCTVPPPPVTTTTVAPVVTPSSSPPAAITPVPALSPGVSAVALAAGSPPVTASPLAFTGADVLPLVFGGSGLILAGSVLLLIRRWLA
jgi:hypothetical protein